MNQDTSAHRAPEIIRGVSTVATPRGPRMTAVMRERETVTPLELFFDLVFVSR